MPAPPDGFGAASDAFGLAHPRLGTTGRILRNAANGRRDTDGIAPGLAALFGGRAQLCRDDLHRLDAGLWICDALHAWTRGPQRGTRPDQRTGGTGAPG